MAPRLLAVAIKKTLLGVLLFTNDVDLAKKMAHPKSGAAQIISVVLDKPLQKSRIATRIAVFVEFTYDGRNVRFEVPVTYDQTTHTYEH